jgi:hypothetical protein
VLVETLFDNLGDDLVGDQFAARDDALDARGEFGVALDVPAEHVTDADVNEVEVVLEHFRLRAFAAALHAHDNVFAHTTSPTQPAWRAGGVNDAVESH